MRILLVALFLTTGCDRAAAPTAEAPRGTRTACALAGAAEFRDVCSVDRTTRDGEAILTLVAPDGGFRRVAVGSDGSAITAADGAEPAEVRTSPSGEVEVAIARDRYRLPATGK